VATYQLRQLSFGEILDGAFALYRRHFGVLVGIAVACVGLPTVLNMYLSMVSLEFMGTGLLLTWSVVLVLYGIGGLVATGATIRAVSDAFLGIEPSLAHAFRFALRKIVKIFFAGLAKYAVIGVAMISGGIVAAILMAVATDALVGGLLLMVIALATLCAALLLSAGYSVVTQTVVLEPETTAMLSLGRSWHLTDGFKVKAVALYVVLAIILTLPYVAATALVLVYPPSNIALTAGAAMLQLLLYPVLPCAFTLFYYDLRVRREAFDLEYLGHQLGIGPDTV
jgi:hypothetical protein